MAPIFQRTIFELLGGVRTLNFNRLGWGDHEAERLAVVLPLCLQLERLELVWNEIGDGGIVVLAKALRKRGAMPRLRTLCLSYNSYGDLALTALSRAIAKKGALPALQRLEVSGLRSLALLAACQARGIGLVTAGSLHASRITSSSGVPSLLRVSSLDSSEAETEARLSEAPTSAPTDRTTESTDNFVQEESLSSVWEAWNAATSRTSAEEPPLPRTRAPNMAPKPATSVSREPNPFVGTVLGSLRRRALVTFRL